MSKSWACHEQMVCPMSRRYPTVEEWRASPEGESAARVCERIGCSGVNERCPGNPRCTIFDNAVMLGLVDDIVDDFMREDP